MLVEEETFYLRLTREQLRTSEYYISVSIHVHVHVNPSPPPCLGIVLLSSFVCVCVFKLVLSSRLHLFYDYYYYLPPPPSSSEATMIFLLLCCFRAVAATELSSSFSRRERGRRVF